LIRTRPGREHYGDVGQRDVLHRWNRQQDLFCGFQTAALLHRIEAAVLPASRLVLMPRAVDVELNGNQRNQHDRAGGYPPSKPVIGVLSCRNHPAAAHSG
jgi:hypothetical protein